MKLVIVESPTKAKHISHMLGSGYQVMASVGHIRDLPDEGESSYVRPPDFRLNYVVSDKKKDVVAKLKKAAASASDIFIATDPDREGEAIAWHLAQVLGVKNAKRVSYQEITEAAIKKALATPGSLNLKLVSAQEARRGLDRMIGWEVSGPISSAVGQQASAGRVQSPALILIVDREEAIRKFVPVDWWSVEAVFQGTSGDWTARWEAPEDHFQDGAFAARIVAAVPSLPFKITEFVRTRKKQSPGSPFTTSALQKSASRSLGFGVDEVMKLAQSLFEQGLITYHRTDSPNLSEEGEAMIREEGEKRKYALSEKPRRWKVKEGAQEAHEAIRPTETSLPNEYSGSTDSERKLFNMIWKRAMASQLADAEFDAVKVVLDAGMFEDKKAVFKGTGSRLVVPGWKSVYGVQEESDEEEESNPVPALEKGQGVRAREGKATPKKTTPAARYTQSSLVDALEKAGIGRPSTYAAIINVLFSRGYIVEQKKSLSPTKLGEGVAKVLVGRFRFAEIDYTKTVEESLDDVAGGKSGFREVLTRFWNDLQVNLKNLPAGSALQMESAESHPCPSCGRPLARIKGPSGFFWGCTGYRDTEKPCKTTCPDERGNPGKAREARKPEGIGPPCPKCGKETGSLETSKRTPYFKCSAGHGPWWSDNGDIGKEWAPFPAKGKSGKKRGVR